MPRTVTANLNSNGLLILNLVMLPKSDVNQMDRENKLSLRMRVSQPSVERPWSKTSNKRPLVVPC